MGIGSRKQSSRGPSGRAAVRVQRKSVRVQFEGGTVWEGTLEDAPKGIFTTPEAFVSLNDTESRIRAFRPYEGKIVAKFVEIYSRTDDDGKKEVPEPTLVEAKDISWVKNNKRQTATIPTHQEFTVVLELLGGDWAGTKAFLSLWYMFEEDSDGSAMQVGRGSEIDKVNEFLRCAGVDFVNDTIKYSDNVLPTLDKLLKSKGEHEFLVEFKKGYAQRVEKLPVGLGMSKAKRTKRAPATEPAAEPAKKRGRPKKSAEPTGDEE